MKKRKCFLFVFDGYADWEPAMAVANMNSHSDFSIHTFSVDGKPVTSMGNLRVWPEYPMNEIHISDVDLLMLPGGDSWEGGGNTEIIPLIEEAMNIEKPIATICGATLFMANQGWLDKTYHTSNGLTFLKTNSANYKGESFYKNEPCVSDKNLITANGAAMIDFAIAIFRKFEMWDCGTIDKISDLYKSSGMNNRLG
jgi:putative intracellular protease/amidase